MEIWRPTRSHPDLYEVSDLGRVKSIARTVEVSASLRCQAFSRPVRERILRPALSRGYSVVTLWCRHEQRSVPIHVLVLEAFVGPRPEGFYGCHKDGDRQNARLTNLYWGTPTENMADARRHGTLRSGARITWAKLTASDVATIRADRGLVPQAVLAARYGVQQSQISRVQTGREWRGA